MESLEVQILGQKYVIRGNESAEYIQQLADYVDKELSEVYVRFPDVTPLRAAILTSLNIANELHRTKNKFNSISASIKTIEDKADSIIGLFD
jgi:Uncharacterized protein conserved in bacteria